MDGRRYRLVFCAELLEGRDAEEVRERLATALKLDGARIEALFSGRPVVLRGSADAAMAERLRVLFENAGARLRVEPLGAAQGEEAPGEASPGTASGEATRGGGAWEVLPAGSDLLAPSERRSPAAPSVDTGHLSLAPAGARLGPERSERSPPPPPDTSHLSLSQPADPHAPA